ncbi:MAG: hypothetical protein NVSMB1_12380 [Polyangiales bacterium]
MRSGAALRPPTSSSPSNASDLGALRRDAEQLAKERGERTSTTHVMVALATRPGTSQDLLADRRITREMLLKAARVVADDDREPVDRLFLQANVRCSAAGARNQPHLTAP